MDFGLAGKTAVVTGGAKGIGAAVCRKLSDGGANVAIFDLDETAGKALAEALDNAAFFAVDVADEAAVNAGVDAAAEHFGGIDLLVNNAGIAPPKTLDNMGPGDWQGVLDINLSGAFNCTRAAVKHMRAGGESAGGDRAGGDRGAIVNVSSVAGKNISLAAGMHYTTSKWGLIGFSRHMAYELAIEGIRVNIVCPGPTLTPLLEPSLKDRAHADANVPRGRLIEPEDVANAILFLLSPAATMCVGAELIVDGGVLIGSGHAYEGFFNNRGSEAPERVIAPREGDPSDR